MNFLGSSAHQFAFFTDSIKSLSAETHQELFHLNDPELIMRIGTILRLQKGDTLILFNTIQHVKATIVGIDARRTIALQLNEISLNKKLTPAIHWLLPLLKRDAFEEALYTLTELGATSIQPLLTQKTQRAWSEKEATRSQKIMIAAAEQSKQFIIPHIHPIIPLDIWLLKSRQPGTVELFFDATGKPLPEALAFINKQKEYELTCFTGPEGDLSYEEKLMLIDRGFVFCALTSTVLRAQQAIAVGLGALRSLL